MAMDLTRTKLNNYSVTFGGVEGGSVDKVTPDITIQTKPIKVGTVGDTILGERIIGLAGKVTVEYREIDRVLLNKMLPWYTSGAIALNPALVHKDLYDYAAILNLHPLDVTDANQDLNLIKAVPRWKPMARDGVNDDRVIVEYSFYPDRSQLPTLVYGYVGPIPS